MTAIRRYHRAEIDASLNDTTVPMTGPVVHVASRHDDSIELWWEHNPTASITPRRFRVVGTGEAFDRDYLNHVGSAVTPSGRFVWHLMEVMHSDQSR